MTSHLYHLAAHEQTADQRRAAAHSHLAAAAANGTRRERSFQLPSLRAGRNLLGLRKTFKAA